jgi:Leucine Rich repeat
LSCDTELRKGPDRSGGSRRRRLVWLLVAAAGASAILFGIVLLIPTRHGTVRIELGDPKAEVQVTVDGEIIHVTGAGEPLKVRAGDHFLKITSSDFETFCKSFTVRNGEEERLTASLIPKKAASIAVARGPSPQGGRLPSAVIGSSSHDAAAWVQSIGGIVERFATQPFAIKAVRLAGNPGLTAAGLQSLRGLASLEILDLTNTTIRDDGLACLKDLFSLRELYLCGVSLGEQGPGNLEKLTRLERLWLTRSGITDNGLVHLQPLTLMRDLSLQDNPISDSGLKALLPLKNLERLDLSYNPRITTTGIRNLTPLSELRALDLNYTRVDNECVKQLSAFPHLRHLGLNGTCISDEGLRNLSGLPGLEELWLERTQISDASWEYINGLKNLRDLQLAGTSLASMQNARAATRSPLATPLYNHIGPVDLALKRLGIKVQLDESHKGLEVTEVTPEGRAAQGRPGPLEKGSIITRVQDEQVPSVARFREVLGGCIGKANVKIDGFNPKAKVKSGDPESWTIWVDMD